MNITGREEVPRLGGGPLSFASVLPQVVSHLLPEVSTERAKSHGWIPSETTASSPLEMKWEAT